MRSADWVQAIIGVLGILATGVVAALVFRLERHDRKEERVQEDDVRHQREQEERERERRAIRRERHKDDYRAVTEVLSKMQSIFEAAGISGKTRKDLEDAGLDQAMRTLSEIEGRVPELYSPLNRVWIAGITLEQGVIPDTDAFTRALGGGPERLRTVVVDTAAAAVRQYEAARNGQLAVAQARSALVKEWGA